MGFGVLRGIATLRDLKDGRKKVYVVKATVGGLRTGNMLKVSEVPVPLANLIN